MWGAGPDLAHARRQTRHAFGELQLVIKAPASFETSETRRHRPFTSRQQGRKASAKSRSSEAASPVIGARDRLRRESLGPTPMRSSKSAPPPANKSAIISEDQNPGPFAGSVKPGCQRVW